MVLKSAFNLFIVVLAGLMAGCLSSHHAAVKAPSPMDVSAIAVMGYADRTDMAGVPAELLHAVDRVLTDRNLVGRASSDEALLSTFVARRTTSHRVEAMAGAFPDADLLLLVEAEPRFYSQLSGRYRWTVEVKLTVAPRERLGEAVTSQVTLPVFLEYYHEKEPEALRAATGLVERNLGYLLDEYLGGLGGAPTGAGAGS